MILGVGQKLRHLGLRILPLCATLVTTKRSLKSIASWVFTNTGVDKKILLSPFKRRPTYFRMSGFPEEREFRRH
ncbi:hypothetical protein RclHR1_08600010 [Rhizophagus clarus]|uniref:Uncharacterized protein n=1 Tax=Rhizophagus clarus TaxID=94130 RepID=A0A2Z6SGG5_9GLOM|nr:hypothetical protein RclHR1_08600010 [Rhizophagus clarus]